MDPETGKALISDVTQMTLFTACGLLFGQSRMLTRGGVMRIAPIGLTKTGMARVAKK